MGIYIHGIEMPKSDHPLWVVIHKDGTVEYNEWNEWKTADGKAVPVPPHGDLIDRDETAKTLAHDYAYAAADMVRNEMPTIIPADGKDIKVPTREEGE